MRALPMILPLLLVAAGSCLAPSRSEEGSSPVLLANPILTSQQSGTTALLQAISPVDPRVVWASGHRGTWVRTVDGGATWESGQVPGGDTLQFRDVHAVSAGVAYLMA